jgi:hypothetical protein
MATDRRNTSCVTLAARLAAKPGRQSAASATHDRAQINPFGAASMATGTATHDVPNGGDERACEFLD